MGDQGDQEVRPKEPVTSKGNEFSLEDKIFIKVEEAEYFIQVTR